MPEYIAHVARTRVSCYPWSSGFGTKITDPSVIGVDSDTVEFNPDASVIVTSPDWNAYSFTSVFGTRYSDPASVGPSIISLKFTPSSNAIIGGSRSTPYLNAWAWSSGFGTKYSDPSTAPTAQISCVDVSSNENYVATNQSALNYVIAYNWSSSGFGTKFTNSGTLGSSATTGNYVHFNPASTAVAIGHARTPYIAAFAFSSSGFGTKYGNPATLPSTSTNECLSIKFSPNGNYVTVGTTSSAYVHVYNWSTSTGFGTKISNPSTLPNASDRKSVV